MSIAMIFPGQASQYVGMGRELYEGDPASRDLIDGAEAALGLPLTRLCFAGPLAELTETRHAQPAILAVSLACQAYLARHGVTPTVTAGHSLGEYAALVAAEVLAPGPALELVALRGRLMFESGVATPGTMAAVMGLGSETVTACCREAAEGEVVQLANINSPEQLVISGAVPAVERAMAACEAAGARKVVRLTVSGAFHSALMASAAAALGEALAATEFSRARVPVIPNVTGTPTQDGGELRRLLIEQLTRPVLWTDSMLALRELDAGPILEVGPGKVLTGLMRRIDRAAPVTPVGDKAALDGWLAAGRAAGGAP
ncbi:MAG: ACP S-malonyltransferase [Candidatus Krumholzibacteriota bacterium]|nr:ACP S-malonyltransferase [Candidatus Krumholzibacteriota bacterium]